MKYGGNDRESYMIDGEILSGLEGILCISEVF